MTLADFETGKRNPYPRTLADIEAALVIAGAVMVWPNDDDESRGSGVRFIAASDEALAPSAAREFKTHDRRAPSVKE